MIIILLIIFLPVIYLIARISLILSKAFWSETDCEIVSFEIIQKRYGFTDFQPEDLPCNYVSVSYKYHVNGKEIVAKRISLDLIDRGYRPIELEHDPFIKYLKNKVCRAYYCKYLPKLAVLTKEKHHVASNLSFLLIYITVILSSYLSIIYWPIK